MGNIRTAEEFIDNLVKIGKIELADSLGLEQHFIEFAKLHVKAALENAAEKGIIRIMDVEEGDEEWEDMKPAIVKESILLAYPPENIK